MNVHPNGHIGQRMINQWTLGYAIFRQTDYLKLGYTHRKRENYDKSCIYMYHDFKQTQISCSKKISLALGDGL